VDAIKKLRCRFASDVKKKEKYYIFVHKIEVGAGLFCDIFYVKQDFYIITMGVTL